MKLLIAEKYKVAQSFAKILGCTERHTTNNKGTVGYLASPDGEWIVSWAAGHVIGMEMPDAYNEKYKHWKMEDLPIFPDKFKYHVSRQEPAKSQYKVLHELLHRDDLAEVIGATDADREGELIFHEILREAKANPKLKYWRCWYTNTTDAAIKRTLEEMKPLQEYKALNDAANCRQQLDWLWGMNMSRCLTIYSHTKSNVGRVVSPTINLIVKRQEEIDAFVPEDYATIVVPLKKEDKTFKAEAKFTDIPYAENLAKTLKGKDAEITNVEKTQKSETRKLFNTTQLQAEASKKFGYEPDATMKILQDLYDAGYVTYPRTKSNSINPDQVAETEPLPAAAWKSVFMSPKQCDPSTFDIQRIVGEKGKNAEEASHTGICPTDVGINEYQNKIKSNERWRNIFLLITCRMICSVMPPRLLDKTKIDVKIDKDMFKATGSVETSAGFADFERYVNAALKSKKEKKASEQVLPDIQVGEIYTCQTAKCTKKQTKPPSQYTTAQLLETMENISRIISDKKMKEMLKDAGLGTAASRDTVIATIKQNGFVDVKGGKLYPTEKAKSLMALLPDDVKSPIMTGQMELDLDAISRGENSPQQFLDEIKQRIVKEIDTIQALPPIPDTERYKDNKMFVANGCPHCGADIVETDKSFVCRHNCGFIMWRTIAKKKVPKTEFKALLDNGHSTQKLEGFKSKKGSDFSCWLYLDGTEKIAFDFDNEGTKAKNENLLKLRGENRD